MPLLKLPHLVVELSMEVTYCDGAHLPDDGTRHDALASMTVFTLVPPGDLHTDLHWPPTSDMTVQLAIEAATRSILMGLSEVMLDIPGCQPVLLEGDSPERPN